MTWKLTDKPIALITGGAQGIGYASAEAIAENGAQIVLADINAEGVRAAAEKMGNNTLAITCDLGEPEQIQQMFDQIEAERGPVSILVNNAGIEGEAVTTPETATLADWKMIQKINVEGVFLGCRSAIPLMRQSGGGCIINISSIGSIEPTPHNMAYGASKAAVRHMTKSVALHCAKDGSKIRCNSVHPGVIRTAMLGRLAIERAKGLSISEDELFSEYQAEIPQNEFQEIEDIANAVLFLASDEARHITALK